MTRIQIRGLVLLAALVLPLLPVRAAGAEERCSDTADRLLFKTKSWADLRRWFTRYADCDDGYLAEGLDDYVAVFLASKWRDLPKLEREIQKEPRFREFVLLHIGATANDDDLEAARNNATQRCPARSAALCAAIASKAQSALEEIRRPQ
jgi:hypothetical protein